MTGAGERFFSAGWDLKAAAEGETPDADFGVGGFGGLQELPGLNKPVIAAVNGMAVGGGFELALSADLILAAEHARFALPEIKAGQLADAATIKLPRRIPHHVAMELLLTGRWMDAEEARRWGLVNEVVPGGSPAGPGPRARGSARGRPAAGVRRDQGGRSARPRTSPSRTPSIWSRASALPPSGRSTRARMPRKGRAPLPRSGIRSGRGADELPLCSRPLA